MTLVDTNVLLDIATNDPKWATWSLRQLDAAAIRGPVLINAVVYAELSIGYARIEEVDKVLADVDPSARGDAARRLCSWQARRLQRFSSAHWRLRAPSVLPDFFIGARRGLSRDLSLLSPRSASVHGGLTCRRGVELIAPDANER